MANFTQLNLQGSAGQKDPGKEFRPRYGNQRRIFALVGSAVAGLVLSTFLLQTSGCSRQKDKPALVNPSNQISSAQPVAPAVTTPAATDTKPAVPKKRARRKSSIVTYRNTDYGVSFRYPRNYVLKTGDDPQRDLPGPAPVDTGFVQPGGVTLAAVEMPRNSYPSSDLSSAYFSVSVNPNLTAEECAQFSFAVPGGPEVPSVAASKVKIGTIEYSELENAAKLSGARYYHVFENGACYEFGLGLRISPEAAESGVADLNFTEVFGKLEKMLATVKISSRVTPEVAIQAPAPAVETTNH